MDEYLEATTVHGFSYVNRRNSICTRIFWTVIIVAGFSMAGYLIIESLNDWESNQTITTLDSIATRIQEVQFPTVTVCPHEESPPDNWSFLEKFLNALAFTGEDAISENLRSDIEDILMQLLLKIEEMFRKFPNSKVWIHNADQVSYVYGNVLTQAANLVCKEEINLSSLRKKIIEGFMKGQFFEPFVDNLDGGYDYIDYYYNASPYPCDDNCCQNYKEQPFFIGIINAGYFLFRQQSMGFGTFVANFANLTSGIIGKEGSIFDLEMKLKLSGVDNICNELSSMDKFLHGYFQNLSIAIGFAEAHSFSLFDIPSMFSIETELERSVINTREMLVKEVFLYSQCQRKTFTSDFHLCYYEFWTRYINFETNSELHVMSISQMN